MRRHDEKVEEVRVVEKIMRFLHSRFDYIAVEIEESNKLEEILVEEVQGSIQVYEERGLRKKKEDVWSKHCKPTLPKRRMASQKEATSSKGSLGGQNGGRGDRNN